MPDPTIVPDPAQQPEPKPVTQEDLDKMKADHTAEIQRRDEDSDRQRTQFTDSLAAINAARQQQQPTDTLAVSLNPEDLKDLVETGETDKFLNKFNAVINDKLDRRIRDEVDPIRTQGSAAIAQLAKIQASRNDTMPHYKRFEKEINAQVDKMSPEVRANPAVYEKAYQMIVGENFDALLKEEKEKILRQASEPEPTMTPGTGGRNGSGKDEKVPVTPETYFSKGALEKFNNKKMDKEKLAVQSGFATWDDMQVFNEDTSPSKLNYYNMLEERKKANAS